MFNIKQQNELFCTAKNSWTRMRPEARPIEFTNGRTHFYGKKKWIVLMKRYLNMFYNYI